MHRIPLGAPPWARRAAGSIVALAAAAVMAGCGPVAPTGGLDVRITGLPAGLDARVTLVDPNGGARVLTASAAVTGLAPGPYELLVADVCATTDEPCAETDLFRPAVPALDVDVVGSVVRDVDVRYGCALLAPPDANLASELLDAVRLQLGDPNATLSCANVGALTSFSPGRTGIADIDGLQHAHTLEFLSLDQNPDVADLTPIAGLTSLVDLRIGYAGIGSADALIEDLSPLSGLVNLEALYVGHVRATELPDLSRLVALRNLTLEHLDLVDLGPLAVLTQLTRLDLGYCVQPNPASSSLSDLTPIQALANLTDLRLGCHDVTDVSSLADLTGLAYLDLRGNRITDLAPLDGLTVLQTLRIDENPVRDLPALADWPHLETLTASWTGIDDLRPVFLHVSAHDTLRTVNLSTSCTSTGRVPNAGYASVISAAGVTLTAGARGAACGYGLDPPPALATFEVDTEGWATAGDAVNLRRVASGGPSGGPYLEADDGEPEQTSAWFWDAGPVFLGNAAYFLGGELELQMRRSSDELPTVGVDVILDGAGRTLLYSHGVTIGTDWTEVVVPLTEGAGWVAEGGPASEADLEEVLGDVTRLRIRGEYQFGPDTGGLGYVRLAPAAPN